jgi:hypothetical protein
MPSLDPFIAHSFVENGRVLSLSTMDSSSLFKQRTGPFIVDGGQVLSLCKINSDAFIVDNERGFSIADREPFLLPWTVL